MLEPLFQIIGLTIKLSLAMTVGLLVLWFRWMAVNPLIRLPVSIAAGLVTAVVIGLYNSAGH